MLNTIFFYALMFAVIGVPFYFRYQVEEFGIREETLDRINQISARLTSFIIGALFLMGFIGIQTKSSTLQEAAFFSCLFSFILLHSHHGKILNQFRESNPTPEERFKESFRNFWTFFVLYIFYFMVVELLIPHLGTIPSIIIAVIAITYAVPVLVRFTLRCQPMHPSELKDSIREVFEKAGTTVGEIYLINQGNRRFCNAFVCGPKMGFGPFRRSLFLTSNLFEVLEPEEIKAVISHEASHFQQNHIFKRAVYSIGILILTIACITFPAVFVATLLDVSTTTRGLVVAVSTLFTIYVELHLLMKLIRKQEYQADQGAMKIGCHPGALIQALEKITKRNLSPRKSPKGWNRFFTFQTHPSMEDRIEAIIRREIPSEANLVPTWQTAFTYASFVILAVSVAFIYRSEKFDASAPSRTIASVPNNGPTVTRQKLPPPKIPIKWDDEASDE